MPSRTASVWSRPGLEIRLTRDASNDLMIVMRRFWCWTCLGATLMVGCGGGRGDANMRPDASTPTDAQVQTDGARVDGDASPPNISEALNCGMGSNGAGPGPNNANSLQRSVIDTRAFPDALCNDGSPAAIFFRPYQGEANRNRWLINLRGGGSCGGGQSCAARWCGCAGMNVCPSTPADSYTNFDRGNMTTAGAASQIQGGIFSRGVPGQPNPIEGFNQVRIVYCSSDSWAGTRRASPLNATHPVTGSPVTYSIHFLGARILDAVFATLRADGAPSPRYTLAGANAALPDLDEATDVVIAGDSGGAAGVINNLDRLSTMLRMQNTRCRAGGACSLTVRGLIDAFVGPDKSRLGLAPDGNIARAGITNYAGWTDGISRSRSAVAGFSGDESCVTWHRANMPGTESRCFDENHVIRHHVTTPFFIRMALEDSLISGNYASDGWTDPMLGRFDPRANVFARVLRTELRAFPMLRATAEEGASFTRSPGVFAPQCTNHDTINENTEVFDLTITPNGGGMADRFFTAFGPWLMTNDDIAVISDPTMNRTFCPPAR